MLGLDAEAGRAPICPSRHLHGRARLKFSAHRFDIRLLHSVSVATLNAFSYTPLPTTAFSGKSTGKRYETTESASSPAWARSGETLPILCIPDPSLNTHFYLYCPQSAVRCQPRDDYGRPVSLVSLACATCGSECLAISA
ncbi:hypothetical protein IFR04_010033 [Cadophora malorum]|uniref:Uncharacterized protein n=1 Tax=Cadophora malorum TaxID=108018 RepID=A0A8H7TCV7_9HELO|nr:hypothetical protein IFR04_010033 [Cadophora malorum]